MGYEHVELTWHDWYATVTLVNPERRNALSQAVLEELIDAFGEVGASDVRGAILAAEGPAFSAGHDFADMVDRDLLGMRELLATCRYLMLLLNELPQVVLARVHAVATAAGCQLVASCDLAVASEEARFATPGGGGGWFCHTPLVAVARSVGRKRALEMGLTGDPIDARTALDWGLLNRVVPAAELDSACLELLGRATRGSAASKAWGKQTFYAQVDRDLGSAYDLATEVMAAASQLQDAKENMRAFMEKRAATYVDR